MKALLCHSLQDSREDREFYQARHGKLCEHGRHIKLKDGSAQRRFYVALHETVRGFYQAKTVKTHSNNLVVLAHVQLKSFYRLSTREVTHVRI